MFDITATYHIFHNIPSLMCPGVPPVEDSPHHSRCWPSRLPSGRPAASATGNKLRWLSLLCIGEILFYDDNKEESSQPLPQTLYHDIEIAVYHLPSMV